MSTNKPFQRNKFVKKFHEELQATNIPGKTPAKPSAFSISSSTGKVAMDSSLALPNKADEGYILVPIPKRLPVSLAIANWSPDSDFKCIKASNSAIEISEGKLTVCLVQLCFVAALQKNNIVAATRESAF